MFPPFHELTSTDYEIVFGRLSPQSLMLLALSQSAAT